MQLITTLAGSQRSLNVPVVRRLLRQRKRLCGLRGVVISVVDDVIKTKESQTPAATTFTPSPLFERVERARRRKHKIKETHITLAHGSGRKAMHELVEGLFVEYFRNPLLEQLEDQAVFDVRNPSQTNGHLHTRMAFTTDSYLVDPIFFPGGDIGIVGSMRDAARGC